MGKQLKRPSARVIVEFEGNVVYVARLKAIAEDKASVESTLDSNYNLLEVSQLLAKLAEAEQTNYYMSRVRELSSDAREAIEKALGEDEDFSERPF